MTPQPIAKHAIITSVYSNGRLLKGVTITDIVEVEVDCWRGKAIINGAEVAVNKTRTFAGWVANDK